MAGIFNAMSTTTCIFCHKTFSRKDNLLRHLASNNCNDVTTKIEIHRLIEEKNKDTIIKEKEIEKLKKNIIESCDNTNKVYLKDKELIKEYKQTIENQNNTIKLLKENICEKFILDDSIHDTLIELNNGYSGVYLALISDDIIKFGKSSVLRSRVCTHLKDFGRFELFYFVRNIDSDKLEKNLKHHILLKPHLISLDVNEVKHGELFKLNDKLTIKDIKNVLLKESRKLEKHQHLQIHNSFETDE